MLFLLIYNERGDTRDSNDDSNDKMIQQIQKIWNKYQKKICLVGEELFFFVP